MKEKIKLIIVFILGIMISVVISVYAATVITGSEVSYTDNKSIGASNVQDAIDGTYSKANTLATNVTSLTTRVTNLESKILKSSSGYVNMSGGVKVIDLGSTKNVVSCFGYVPADAAILAICGVQSGRYIRLSVAYNATVASAQVWYQYWYYD